MPDPREPYGRMVHDVRLAHEAVRAAAEGRVTFRLGDWEDRSGHQRELDMAIGAAVAAAAVAAERERIRQLAIRSHAVCIGDDGMSIYFAALIGEPEERNDEKEEPAVAEELHPIQQAYADALAAGGPAEIPLERNVLCDIDDTDLTEDARSGGFLFGSYAVGPCCAERYLATIQGYGEEWNIRARCPEGVSFADWVRGMRGPDAAITITPGRPGTWRP